MSDQHILKLYKTKVDTYNPFRDEYHGRLGLLYEMLDETHPESLQYSQGRNLLIGGIICNNDMTLQYESYSNDFIILNSQNEIYIGLHEYEAELYKYTTQLNSFIIQKSNFVDLCNQWFQLSN